MTILCPKCAKPVTPGCDACGQPVSCPWCAASFPMTRGHVFAARSGIDLSETHDPGEPGGMHGAQARAGRVKQGTPPVPSAYQPSGRVPPAALAGLVGGALLGALAGATAALAVAGLAGACSYGVSAFGSRAEPGSQAAGMALIIALLVLFAVGSVGGYVALGRVAALVTTALGRRWKNRSTFAAVSASLAAAALGSALYYVVMLPILDWAGLELQGYADAERMGTLVRVGAAVGGALAVAVAGYFAYKAALLEVL